jgi:anti-sigma B factor antagonist
MRSAIASRWPDDVAGPPHAPRAAVCPGTPPVVKIGGEIDVLSAPDLREELLRLMRRRGPQLALDLSGVTFMDCAGIGALLATRRRAQLEGGWLRIVRASPPARRTIGLLGLAEALALGACT